MVKRYVPEKGDIVHLDFNPTLGHEQKGKRYAVVVSHSYFNLKTGMSFVIPITSKIKNYPTHVIIEEGKINGAAMVDQMRSIDFKARNVQFVQKLSDSKMEKILDIIESIIFTEE
ncbi:transcriptional regulator, PemK family [Deferribacter desulfuricans SSM1]|uniref:Transcriptional regulator, PemK family n=1 Tax=Deferribacter desulfuricans (strain DSM 14783 / JCM 11476 / NBRC 101012 / SSM1) TaxID=639282 RepID=D3PCP9_DEFDS|nr:type II toxin-antitoxin system PemK/MazF family toxin [Deferribacter desulfuricans]BAI80372.1 transcriptional regulator, PemK family [Deferribacter desulfuricans SSM1]